MYDSKYLLDSCSSNEMTLIALKAKIIRFVKRTCDIVPWNADVKIRSFRPHIFISLENETKTDCASNQQIWSSLLRSFLIKPSKVGVGKALELVQCFISPIMMGL